MGFVSHMGVNIGRNISVLHLWHNMWEMLHWSG